MAYASDIAKQWTSYDTGPGQGDTIREDLSDVITIMSPLDTPLLSMLPQVPVSNDFYEWPIDDIPTPDATDGKVEGADAIFPTVSAVGEDTRFRVGNGTVITAEYIDVSDTERVVNLAGVEDEFAYQVWKKTLRMAKQMEFNLHWGTFALGSDSGAGTARQTEGFYAFAFHLAIEQATVSVAGKTWRMTATTGRESIYNPVYHDPGTPANLTRTILHDDLLTPAWRNGMQVEGAIGLMGAKIKFLVADFAIAATDKSAVNERIIPAEARMMIDTIDIIRTDFGFLYLNLDRYLDGPDTRTVALDKPLTSPTQIVHTLNKTILIFQPGMLEIGTLRPASFTLLAKIGDATKGMVVMEAGTKTLNPIALIAGNDLAA